MKKLSWAVAAAAATAGLALLFRRRQLRAAAEADLWAEATDYVTPTRREE